MWLTPSTLRLLQYSSIGRTVQMVMHRLVSLALFPRNSQALPEA